MTPRTSLYAMALATTALAGGLPAHAAPINLVANPGFETGNFTGWTVSGSFPNIGVDSLSVDVHSGNYGALPGTTCRRG